MFNWFKNRRSIKKQEEEIYESVIYHVLNLSPEQAKVMFSKIENKFGDKYLEIKNTKTEPSFKINSLPKYIKEFFSTYISVGLIFSELTFSHELIKQSELHPDCLCIGQDIGFSEIVFHPQKKGIYLLYNDDPYTKIEEYFEEGFQSIYNCLIERLCIHEQILKYLQAHFKIT